ncbi:MAG: DUF1972 domain-containing protein [Chitinophagaceae bacterium]|nr:DUF1972 domain-containing protein [Chitinophagaceae bacterium]
MRKLKIGILGTRGIPNHYGGFEQFAEQLSLGLIQRGHEVCVYNSSLHPYKEREWKGVQIITRRDWEHKIGTAGQFFYDLNCINDARSRNFDVLLHLGYTSDSIWHWRWPKNAANIVNMDGMEWKRSKYNKPTQRFLRWAESLAARNAHTLIADSPSIQDHLLATYGKNPVFIPYGAEPFLDASPGVPVEYGLVPNKYFLVIARMEPENNIEMIVRGHISSGHSYPLLVIGNITTPFGKYLTNTYKNDRVIFHDAIYDKKLLDNLRFYSSLYFHGHSVGGTNPSLLEAMACGCRIAAHNNRFNRAVLNEQAEYFHSHEDIASLIYSSPPAEVIEASKKANLEKIVSIYNKEKITNAYEQLMLNACGEKKLVLQPVTLAKPESQLS